MDGTMCGNGLLGYFAGARLGRSEDIGGLTEGWINLYRIFRPDIVVADYSPTANPFFNSVIEQLVGLARRPCRSRTCGANCAVGGLMATHQLRGRDQRGQLLPRVEHARL
jgi:hypothetical protein